MSSPLFAKRNENLKLLFSQNRGGRSSMVEPQIVILVVAGSSPVGHPSNFKFRVPIVDLEPNIDNYIRSEA
jgi:hypothetical protein